MLTINVNGLTLCHKGSDGISHNTLPDVCKTPPFGVPIPYENEAYSADLIKGTISVFADGGNMIANVGSQFARSVFDEPGCMGGVISGTNRAEAEWISHSFDVFFEKKPACRLTDKMFMNHRNTVNMAGEWQKDLPPGGEDKICDAICKCRSRISALKAKGMKGLESFLGKVLLSDLGIHVDETAEDYISNIDDHAESLASEMNGSHLRQACFAGEFAWGNPNYGPTPKDPRYLVEVPYNIWSKSVYLSEGTPPRYPQRRTYPGGPLAPMSKMKAVNRASQIGGGKIVIWDLVVLKNPAYPADWDNVSKILEIKFDDDKLTKNQTLAINNTMGDKVFVVDEEDCKCDDRDREDKERAMKRLQNLINEINKSMRHFWYPGIPKGPGQKPDEVLL